MHTEFPLDPRRNNLGAMFATPRWGYPRGISLMGAVGAMRIIVLVVLIWLIIGAVAAGQRGYYSNSSATSCASAGTIAVTVIAGPLNYLGVNPKISDCTLPQPSQ